MGKKAKLLLIMMILMMVIVVPVQAQDAVVLSGRSLFDVNIRTIPGTGSALIGVLPGNQDVSVVGRSPGNNWVQIEYQETTGWVASWLMVFNADTSLLPITTDVQPPTTGVGPLNLRSPYNLNVRNAPGIGGAVLGRLPHSTEVVVNGRNDISSWVRIDYNGQEGWVAAWLVILSNDINSLPIDDSSAAPPVPTPVGGEPDETPTPSPTPDADNPPPPAPETGITITVPFRINIRSAPSVSGNVINVLTYGVEADAIGRNAGNNWIQIETGGTRGWVAAWVVLASSDTAALPITSSSTEVTPAAAQITGKGFGSVIIRTFPDQSATLIGTLPANTDAFLTARTENSSWVKVSYEGVEGWVAMWVIVASGDINNLPVETGE